MECTQYLPFACLDIYAMAVQVKTVLTSPLKRAQATAQTISKVQSLAGYAQPKVQIMEELTNRTLGGWEGRRALEVWASLNSLQAVLFKSRLCFITSNTWCDGQTNNMA